MPLREPGPLSSPPGPMVAGQQMCTVWERVRPRPARNCRNKLRGGQMRVPESEPGIGTRRPLPSNPLSRNPWLWDRTAVVELGEAPRLGACPGPLARRTRCSQVRWPPPSGAGRLPNRCLSSFSSFSSLPAPHSPAASLRPLPPL